MAYFAAMVLADGQAAPANHTFNPSVKKTLPSGELFYSWVDLSVNSGIPAGGSRIEMTVRMPTYAAKSGSPDNALAVSTKVVVATMESLSTQTASGILAQPQRAFETTVWTKTYRDGRSAAQTVKDAWAYTRNFSQVGAYTETVLSYSAPI